MSKNWNDALGWGGGRLSRTDEWSDTIEMAHYHAERNHQGLKNRLLQPFCAVDELHASIERRPRLGGMLSYYYRHAA